jgi:hypothetical protein
MSAAAERRPDTVPDGVRSRIIAFAADVLPQVVGLPATLRKVAGFAPARRGRLGGTQIWAALTADDDFRGHVAVQAAGARPALAAVVDQGEAPEDTDPADLAALLWLSRPEGWEEAYDAALGRLEAVAAPREAAERERLQGRIDAAEQALRDARAEHKAALE